MILQINKQLKQREKDELQRFGIEEWKASDVGYDTPDDDEGYQVPERMNMQRSASAAKKTGNATTHTWSSGFGDGGEKPIKRQATRVARDRAKTMLPRAEHGLSPYPRRAGASPYVPGPKARTAQKALLDGGSSRVKPSCSSASKNKPGSRRVTRFRVISSLDEVSCTSSFNDREDSKRHPEAAESRRRRLAKQLSRSPKVGSRKISLIQNQVEARSESSRKQRAGSQRSLPSPKGSIDQHAKTKARDMTISLGNLEGQQIKLANSQPKVMEPPEKSTKGSRRQASANTKKQSPKKMMSLKNLFDLVQISEAEAYERLARQSESLIHNGYNIQIFHPEEGNYQKKDFESQSFGTISSADEKDCEIMFRGDFSFRFQAIKKIHNESIEAERKRALQAEIYQKQNGFFRRFLSIIFCRKRRNQVTASLRRLRGLNLRQPRQAAGPGINQSQQVGLGASLTDGAAPAEAAGPQGAWSDQKLNRLKVGNSSVSMTKVGFEIHPAENNTQNSPRSKTENNSRDDEKDESGEGEELARSLEEGEDLAPFEKRPNLCLRITKRLDRLMFSANSRKMKLFQVVVSLLLYADIILTSLLLGNLHYQQGRQDQIDWLGHHAWYSFIIAFQGTDILLNFFKIVVQDVVKLDTFVDKALYYIKFYFWVDLISAFPYHTINPQILYLRFLKIARFRSCQKFLVESATEVFADYVANDNLKKWLDTVSMIMMLLLVSHFFACIWILIGMHQFTTNETGWIAANVETGLVSAEMPDLYVASLYFIILSFSSIGYGDITPGTDIEYQYTLIVQMCGIGIYGYMIGTIQTLFMDIGQDDPLTEQQELINLWLVKIDRSKPSVILSKKVFSDVRDFYMKKFKHETKLVVDDPEAFFTRLKPRIQKLILDTMFQTKYDHFKNLFIDCCKGFQRELIQSSTFRYQTAQQEADLPDDHFKDSLDQPVLIEAHRNDNDLYLILSGHIYVMDSTGMYGYGIIRSGSYFGDISILLNQPNQYSYFYNPFSEKPLQLLKIKRKDFLTISSRYPVEHEIWKQRAQKREQLFESYKTLNLLKYMKAIVKKPKLIKEIDAIYDPQLKRLQRVTYWREQHLKLAMIRLFLFQYSIKRMISHIDSKKEGEQLPDKNDKKQGKHRAKATESELRQQQKIVHKKYIQVSNSKIIEKADEFEKAKPQPNKAREFMLINTRINVCPLKGVEEGKEEEQNMTVIEFANQEQFDIRMTQTRSKFRGQERQSPQQKKGGKGDQPTLNEDKDESDGDGPIDSSRALLPQDADGTAAGAAMAETLMHMPLGGAAGRVLEALSPDVRRQPGLKLTDGGSNARTQRQSASKLASSQNKDRASGDQARDPAKEFKKQSTFLPGTVRNPELAAALRRAHEEVPKIDLQSKTREELTQIQASSIKDIAALIQEYLYQKRRKIKRTQTAKNSLFKVTALYKEKHKVIKSRDIAHLDTIIEEYLNLDEINNQLLFAEKSAICKQEAYPVNHSSVTSLAYNQRLLSQDVKQAIDKEVRANDDFHLIKIHGIHLCNHELNAFNTKLADKFAQLEGKFAGKRAEVLRKTVSLQTPLLRAKTSKIAGKAKVAGPLLRGAATHGKTKNLQRFYELLDDDMKRTLLEQLESKIHLYEKQKQQDQSQETNEYLK